MKNNQFLQFTVLILFLTSFLSGCSAPIKYWPSKTAQVIDKETNEPIADVHVLVKWYGIGGGIHAQTRCYHVEATKTDKKGYFTMPGSLDGLGKSFLGRRYVSVEFYKPGYTGASKGGKSYYDMDKVYMAKFKGTREERFKFFFTIHGGASCSQAGTSKRNAYKLHKAIYEEAKLLLPVTKKEIEDLKWLRLYMASVIDTNYMNFTGVKQEAIIEEIIANYEKELLDAGDSD